MRLLPALLPLVLVTGIALCAQPRPSPARPDGLVSGPMLAYQEHREVLIWLEVARERAATLTFWPAEQPEATTTLRPARTLPNPIGTDILHFIADGLEVGREYAYRLAIDGRPVEVATPLRFRAKAQWEWRGDPPTVTFAIGSCSYLNDPPFDRPGRPYGQETTIYNAIAQSGATFMVWLGDNLYLREADWTSRYGIFYRYSFDRRHPDVQSLLARLHHYATWDDHEYGSNDAVRSFPLKRVSLEAFQAYFPQAETGEIDNPGIYFRFKQGDAEFFVLDGRFHRDDAYLNEEVYPEKSFLGRRQLEWFLSGLSDSQEDEGVAVRFVAIGSQFLNPFPFFENLSRYSRERQRILDFIAGQKIDGVVFLTGDRHFGELSRLDRAGTAPVYEFTSSALSAGANTRPVTEGEKWAEANNPVRVPGTVVAENHFGLISISGPRRERVLTFSAQRRDGSEVWQRSVPVSELRHPRPAR